MSRSSSYMTIDGLRFRRVLLTYSWDRKQVDVSDVPTTRVCDAMICCRCTTLVLDDGEAVRHVCLSRYWQAGDAGSVEFNPGSSFDQHPCAWTQVGNHMPRADLWPHCVKPFNKRRAPALSERYEALATLLAGMSKMEAEIERNRMKKPRRRRIGGRSCREVP